MRLRHAFSRCRDESTSKGLEPKHLPSHQVLQAGIRAPRTAQSGIGQPTCSVPRPPREGGMGRLRSVKRSKQWLDASQTSQVTVDCSCPPSRAPTGELGQPGAVASQAVAACCASSPCPDSWRYTTAPEGRVHSSCSRNGGCQGALEDKGMMY